MKEFIHRLIASLVLIPFASLLLYSRDSLWMAALFLLFLSCLGVAALWEYIQFVKVKGSTPSLFVLASVALSWIFVIFFQVSMFYLIFPFCFFLLTHLGKREDSIHRIATGTFALAYIVPPFLMWIDLLLGPSLGPSNLMWVLYLLLVTKCTDISAYFFGKLFGTHPMASSISPRKTWEGAIGGVLVGITLSFCFTPVLFFSPFRSIFLGASLSILAVLGDLLESQLKRDAKLKDSNCIPGIGGALDLIDSLLMTTPILYAYLKLG